MPLKEKYEKEKDNIQKDENLTNEQRINEIEKINKELIEAKKGLFQSINEIIKLHSELTCLQSKKCEIFQSLAGKFSKVDDLEEDIGKLE